MSPYDRIGIIEGFVECPDAATYLNACVEVTKHGPHGVLHGSLGSYARELSERVDAEGFDAVLLELESP